MNITINELAKRVNVSNGCVRNWALKVNVGDTYTANYCNIVNIKAQLVRLYDNDVKRLNDKLGFDYNELNIVRNERRESAYIAIDDMTEGSTYIMRHYHYEKTVTFIRSMIEDDTDLYLFKDEDGHYLVLTDDEMHADKLNFKDAE